MERNGHSLKKTMPFQHDDTSKWFLYREKKLLAVRRTRRRSVRLTRQNGWGCRGNWHFLSLCPPTFGLDVPLMKRTAFWALLWPFQALADERCHQRRRLLHPQPRWWYSRVARILPLFGCGWTLICRHPLMAPEKVREQSISSTRWNQSINRSNNQSINQSMEKSIEAFNQWRNQSINSSIKQSMEKSIEAFNHAWNVTPIAQTCLENIHKTRWNPVGDVVVSGSAGRGTTIFT